MYKTLLNAEEKREKGENDEHSFFLQNVAFNQSSYKLYFANLNQIVQDSNKELLSNFIRVSFKKEKDLRNI